jgi:mono/diheme cytochrome c family protein
VKLALTLVVALTCVSCAPHETAEGIPTSTLPDDVRADYQVFAQRCSKCHSLARPLQSGIVDDEFWKEYVERMRRQAGSGISPSDEEPILRFLHYYSTEQKRKRGGSG